MMKAMTIPLSKLDSHCIITQHSVSIDNVILKHLTLLHYRKRKSPKKSPSKSLSDSRAGAGTNYKSKEYISSSGSNSSGSDSDDKPLKKKPKKDQGTKEKKKKEKAPETKRKSKRQNKGSESESSVGEVSISDPCNVYSFYLNWYHFGKTVVHDLDNFLWNYSLLKINVFSFKMYFYSSVTRWRRNSRYPSIIRKISIGIRVRLNTATHGLGFVISWHCIKIFLQFMKSIDVSSHFLLQECIMCTKKYQCCVGTKTTLAFINVYMWLKNRFSLT